MNRLGEIPTSFWLAVIQLASGSMFGQMAASQATQPGVGGTTGGATSAVPHIVSFGGVLKDTSGRIIRGATGVTFLIYRDQQGGAPLWLETQSIKPDATGRYTTQLGSGSAHGLPPEMFTSGEGRWLAVQIGTEPEQPRVLLVAVPYAMKAADAETLGGLPPSAYLRPESASSDVAPASSELALPPASVTGSGTTGYVPVWTGASALGSSALFQTGSGGSVKFGINTTTPAAMLDVKGSTTIRALLNLPATATATASAGANSNQIGFVASTYNSSSHAPANQVFRWMAEPAGNNTATPSATMNLLFSTAPGVPAETGLKINNKGRITFAAGQTFPGAGTVSSVGLSAPASDFTVSGSPTTSSGTLNLAWKIAPTSADTANAIVKRDGSGNFSATSIQTKNITVTNLLSIPSIGDYGVIASSGGATATVILGQATSATGNARGLQGQTASSDANAYGVYGVATSPSGSPIGVYGTAFSPSGFGVYGQRGDKSAAGGNATTNTYAGVWGDTGASGDFETVGVLGTADDANGGRFENSSESYFSLAAVATNSSGSPFGATNTATGASCIIDASGSLNCTGTKNAVVPIAGGKRKVALSAIESPKNWFEDAGSDRLVGGVAVVKLDPDFLDTVNTTMEYNVFLTPYGDCKGLYVTNRTANSFEVHELGGGSAGIGFGYRVMALRKKYENVRFADHTHDPDISKQMERRATIPK